MMRDHAQERRYRCWRPLSLPLALAGMAALPRARSVPCPKLCTGHGRCDTGSLECQCFRGWFGADCSLQNCPQGYSWADVATADDRAHNLAECSSRGWCDYGLGLCQCDFGFEGNACERKSCPNNCNGHGRCESMQNFASSKDPGQGPVFSYTGVWDADQLFGCNCDEDYFGPDCSQSNCPRGDDPLTGSAADPLTEQYNELQQVVCIADGGSFTLTFRGSTTVPISADAGSAEVQAALQDLPTVSSEFYEAISVTYVGYKQTACTIAGTIIRIEFLQDFGDLPLLQADGSRLTHSYSQLTTSITTTTLVQGTKENSWCSNRGLCDVKTGVCDCMTDYDTSDGYGGPGQRGDCGYATTVISNCPGTPAVCSGHGVCSGHPTYSCECSNGWTGADCSEMTCQYGQSWFSLPTATDCAHMQRSECSDMGICDRTYGICNCMRGFEGAACERMRCPGGDLPCSGHGQCLTMELLATKATNNGDATPFSYGSIPNDPFTWDFAMLQGCFCDEGFFGHDCSLRSCLVGDDPETQFLQVDEVQDLYCEGTTGTLTISFRQDTTTRLSADATTAQLQSALELDTLDQLDRSELSLIRNPFTIYHLCDQALPTIQKVSIQNQNLTDSICEVTGHISRISFLVTHGPLPLMTVSSVGITMTHFKRFLAGTKETLECSGRGLCDYSTGLCDCFTGYTSSNGMSGPGTYDDCGYQEPIIAPFYVNDVW